MMDTHINPCINCYFVDELNNIKFNKEIDYGKEDDYSQYLPFFSIHISVANRSAKRRTSTITKHRKKLIQKHVLPNKYPLTIYKTNTSTSVSPIKWTKDSVKFDSILKMKLIPRTNFQLFSLVHGYILKESGKKFLIKELMELIYEYYYDDNIMNFVRSNPKHVLWAIFRQTLTTDSLGYFKIIERLDKIRAWLDEINVINYVDPFHHTDTVPEREFIENNRNDTDSLAQVFGKVLCKVCI